MVLEVLSYARAIGRSVIGSLFTAGYSANSALRLLMREGIGYRRIDFLADWRELVGVVQKVRFFTEMPDYVRPTRAMMTPKAFPIGEKYTYTFRVNLYDPATEEHLESQNYSISTERILTKGEAEDALVERLSEEQYEGLEYESGELTSVKRRE